MQYGSCFKLLRFFMFFFLTEWMDGWMDGRALMDGWMDGWMNTLLIVTDNDYPIFHFMYLLY